MSFEIITCGDPYADTLLVQFVDDHDLEFIGREVSYIKELSHGQAFCLKAVRVKRWNEDLSPWPAPAVFGSEGFGGRAAETLDFLLNGIPDFFVKKAPVLQNSAVSSEAGSESRPAPYRRKLIGGYSLAGLFALWAGYHTDRFSGIAAASPSVWFPGFTAFMQENTLCANAVYLSLGDREEKTRNTVMARVGSAVRNGYELLSAQGKDCVLEWNPGNHFREPELRTAKAFAWLMNREYK